jgi:EmrB/QacA subfamily drug resistance transporter
MQTEALYEKRWWALAVLGLSLLVISLDNTILNVALPSLRDDLGASASELQWVVDSYLLVFAGLLLTAGSLGDRFGRKRALTAGLAIFAAASIGSALATSAEMLIATRALMGIGGALIMPSTLSIITATFPENERGKAIAAWAAVAGVGIVIGPVVGGALLEFFDWSSVFWVNVPIAAVAIIAGARFVPESRDPRASRLDPVGQALSIAGLSGLVWAIIEAPARGWGDPTVLGVAGAAVVLIAAFIAWELRTDEPMLDVRLFRNRRFTGASAAIAFSFAALMGTIFVLTMYLQSVLGYDALGTGVRMLPLGIGMIIASGASAKLDQRVGTKVVVATGLGTVAAGLGVLGTVDTGSGYGLVAIALSLFGIGMGLAMAPATDSIMGSVSKARASVGSAVNDTTRLVGAALGVAVLGSVVSSGYGDGMEAATDALPAGAAAGAESSIGGAMAVASELPAGTATGLRAAADAAFVSAVGEAAIVAAALAAVGALVAALWLPARPAKAAPEAEERGPAANAQLAEAGAA